MTKSKQEPTDIEMYSDLPGKGIVTNGYGSKPDLFIISRSTMNIALFELTCPLDRNLHKAHTYKVDKYTDLETDLKEKGWTVHIYRKSLQIHLY